MQLPEYAISPAVATAISTCISTARIHPYRVDSWRAHGEPRNIAAIRLYRWNAHMAGALMMPIHLCEVAVRSAAAQTLSTVYGPTWPLDTNFKLSLRDNRRRNGPPGSPSSKPVKYSAVDDLDRTVQKFSRGDPNLWTDQQTESVVADLNLVFWVKLFAANHDHRLWLPHLTAVFPHLPTNNATQWRKDISQRLDQLRLLRNLVAHHERIYNRALSDDIASIRTLIGYRSCHLLEWSDNIETASHVLASRPSLKSDPP